MFDHRFPSASSFLDTPVQPQDDLVTHLVFVGGCLADTWSEDASMSAYADFSRSLARSRRPVEPPAPPAHLALLEWLDEQAGGRQALLALSDAPLEDADVPSPERSADHQRLLAVAELIDGCTSELLRLEEWGNACRRALVVLWSTDRDVVTHAPSAAHLASGLVWAVGKANGWFPTSGHAICTQSELRDHFGLIAYPSAFGKSVQTALRTSWPSSSFHGWGRPTTPEFEPLGRPDLLTASVRRTLLRLRDQALASEAIASSGEFYQAG